MTEYLSAPDLTLTNGNAEWNALVFKKTLYEYKQTFSIQTMRVKQTRRRNVLLIEAFCIWQNTTNTCPIMFIDFECMQQVLVVLYVGMNAKTTQYPGH